MNDNLKNLLRPIRVEIDNIDNQLLELLSKRKEITEKVAQIKSKLQSPVFMPDREALMALDFAQKCEKLDLEHNAIIRIWREIITFTLKNEGAYKVGTINDFYYKNITRSHFGDCTPIEFYDNEHALLDALIEEKITIAVVKKDSSDWGYLWQLLQRPSHNERFHSLLYIAGILPFSYNLPEFSDREAYIIINPQVSGIEGNSRIYLVPANESIEEKHKILIHNQEKNLKAVLLYDIHNNFKSYQGYRQVGSFYLPPLYES